MILCSNPRAQYQAQKEAIQQAVLRVMESGRYILGDEVRALETEFARRVGTGHAVAVASGTDALFLSLMADGIGAGDEVITVAHTALATVAAITLTGAKAVLVDIDPARLTLDPGWIKKAVTSKTKAIVVVHLYGQPADMAAILALAKEFSLHVYEDCAQAHGAVVNNQMAGSIGRAGCFSFYPTKNLGAIGDGGIITTNDAAYARRLGMARQYGWDEQRISRMAGVNSRLDELQAAVLRVKLKYLDKNIQRRREIAGQYQRGLSALPLNLPQQIPGTEHAFHLYVVRTDRRDDLRSYLNQQGIQAGVHYLRCVHQEPGYQPLVRLAGQLPASERAANEVLSLPMYPELADGEVRIVIDCIKRFFE